jgi:hypothetical protein
MSLVSQQLQDIKFWFLVSFSLYLLWKLFNMSTEYPVRIVMSRHWFEQGLHTYYAQLVVSVFFVAPVPLWRFGSSEFSVNTECFYLILMSLWLYWLEYWISLDIISLYKVSIFWWVIMLEELVLGPAVFFYLALQPNSDLDRLHEAFRFTSVTRSRTVSRTPWTGDQLVPRPLPVQKHRKTHTQHKH